MRHSRAADRRHPVAAGVKDLTIASNNAGIDNEGLGKLLRTRQVKKMISSYVGENKEFERQFLAGELEVEFCPQGTLAERMRAGGAGIPGFYTKTGVGTQVAEGKEVKSSTARIISSSAASSPTSAIIKGWKADETGNLMFRKTARNFNLPAATCGKICVAEVEEIVPVGSLDPDCIHLPSIYVNRLILGAPYDKKIEFRTVREREAAIMLVSMLMAAAVAASPASKADIAGIDAAIHGVYDVISGPPGQKRDFDKMRAMFAPNALLRVITPNAACAAATSKPISRQAARSSKRRASPSASWAAAPKSTATSPRVWSAYDGRTANGSFHERGINSFQLVKVDGKWLVASILWQEEGTPVLFPLPKDMIGKKK